MAATAEPSSEPPAVETCWKLPNKPRRFCGAHSTMKAVEVPHSPPAAKPLHDAKRNQQDRRPDADRLIGRQQADADRAERHQEDGQHQRRLAAFGVAEAADHDAAERPRQEADAIGREGGEQRGGRIAVREELCGDQPGEISIDTEIVPFEQVADCCGQDRLVGLVRHMRAWRGQNRSFRHWIPSAMCIFFAIFHMTIRAELRGKARAMTALR